MRARRGRAGAPASGARARREGFRRVWAPGTAALALLAVCVPGVTAQVDSQEESRLLREASALEWRGRVTDAEQVLVRLLTAHPTSSGGLFALERILRNQGRIAQVLPWADRFLEEDPEASGVRYMKLRVLVEADSLSALDPEARAWFRAEPGSPDPYREVARLYQRALGEAAALEVLQAGRAALGSPQALAMEMGDLRASLGDEAAAVHEWSQALRGTQADLPGILRRLDRLEGDPATLAPPLLEALTADPTTPERQATAVRVALQLGMGDQARELADEAAGDLPAEERRAFLGEVVQRADEAGLPEVALWALQEQSRLVSARERTTLDVRIATMALQAGDTAQAVAARTRLARSLPVGSVERRRVIADLIRVEAHSASRETLVTRLEGFANEYPEAPELDELRALVAGGLAARGEADGARELLEGAEGPLASLERAYLHFHDGEVEPGKEALEAALPALAPSRATEMLHLLSFLERVGPPSAVLLARSAAEAHLGRPGAGVDSLVLALPGLPDEDRPPLMAWAGEQAQAAGETQRAEELFGTVVEAFPEAREFPDAALALARLRIARGDPDAAREVLERLILDRPNSPVVPAARRELQRLRSGVGAWDGPWAPEAS